MHIDPAVTLHSSLARYIKKTDTPAASKAFEVKSAEVSNLSLPQPTTHNPPFFLRCCVLGFKSKKKILSPTQRLHAMVKKAHFLTAGEKSALRRARDFIDMHKDFASDLKVSNPAPFFHWFPSTVFPFALFNLRYFSTK